MKMYKTSNYGELITEVEIERKTDKTVWYYPEKMFGEGKSTKLRQERRDTDWGKYFDTKEEAKNYHMNRLQKKMDSAHKTIEKCIKEIKEVESL